MIGGRFRREEMPSWNEIENASPLSEFFIQWNLPEVYIDETGKTKNILFILCFTDCLAAVFFFLARVLDGILGMTRLRRSGGLKNLPRSGPQVERRVGRSNKRGGGDPDELVR